ncbi:MAG: hypothetical protein K8R44_03620 [Sulfurimonas sp.]|nr:hypothetical protein [Sulfurimonas sp.]
MKIIILSLLLISSLFANEIQVFSATSMNIDLKGNLKIEKVFAGSLAEYKANKDLVNQYLLKGTPINTVEADTNKKSSDNTELITETGFAAANVVSSVAYSSGSYSGAMSSNGSLVGLAGVAAVAVGNVAYKSIVSTYDSIVEDYKYIFIYKVEDNLAKQTQLKIRVIANEKLTKEELNKINTSEIKNLSKDM